MSWFCTRDCGVSKQESLDKMSRFIFKGLLHQEVTEVFTTSTNWGAEEGGRGGRGGGKTICLYAFTP